MTTAGSACGTSIEIDSVFGRFDRSSQGHIIVRGIDASLYFARLHTFVVDVGICRDGLSYS